MNDSLAALEDQVISFFVVSMEQSTGIKRNLLPFVARTPLIFDSSADVDDPFFLASDEP